jgi:uncharacterized protein YdeI (YjbR/CyaY-like superfamily)
MFIHIISFLSQEEWGKWLSKNFDKSEGIWIKVFKKDSGTESITIPEALDEALCYGWIDGQRKSYDEKSFLQKYTPKRKKSLWSKVNTLNIERLTKLGKMKPAGIAEVERAKDDGRWEAAYDSPANMTPPKEFLKKLAKNKKAQEFYLTLNKTNTFAISWQIHTAKKEETKMRKIEKFIGMLERGEKIY